LLPAVRSLPGFGLALKERLAGVVDRFGHAGSCGLDGRGVLPFELERDRELGAGEIACRPTVQQRIDGDLDSRRCPRRRRLDRRLSFARLLRLPGSRTSGGEDDREKNGGDPMDGGHGSETPFRFNGTVRRDFAVRIVTTSAASAGGFSARSIL